MSNGPKRESSETAAPAPPTEAPQGKGISDEAKAKAHALINDPSDPIGQGFVNALNQGARKSQE